MVNIKWCLNQEKGIKLIEPSKNLAKEYLKSAEETLNILRDLENKSNMWLATTKYYFEYFTTYAFLLRVGIKCEIHDCTIELSKLLEKENFLPKGTFELLNNDKKLRIENQYYLKNKKIIIDYDEMTNFFLEIKNKIEIITFEEINQIRSLL